MQFDVFFVSPLHFLANFESKNSLWVPLVYCPFVHWIWNPQGFLAQWGVVDFAGGIVVHISAGFAALASVFVVGSRKFETEEERKMAKVPHNRTLVALGTGMLFLGWVGFNGGSGTAANWRDGGAVVNSSLAASFAMMAWIAIEWHHLGKPQLVGACVGAVGGLATVTPAAGYIRPWAAALIGLVTAPFCFGCVQFQEYMHWDDALDVWGVHGMGGVLGSILLGVLADSSIGGVDRSAEFLGKQVAACLFTMVYAFVVSYALLRVVGAVLPLVPPPEMVAEGLDVTIHGEHAYDEDHVVYAAQTRGPNFLAMAKAQAQARTVGATGSPSTSGSGTATIPSPLVVIAAVNEMPDNAEITSDLVVPVNRKNDDTDITSDMVMPVASQPSLPIPRPDSPPEQQTDSFSNDEEVKSMLLQIQLLAAKVDALIASGRASSTSVARALAGARAREPPKRGWLSSADLNRDR
mmetsp:Transcript_85959/g.229359  ORF Transcript_85959/g.229359 Transcript_85959/m.229359 type:complete len:465 (-) Transcript_85959:724-2118(-)